MKKRNFTLGLVALMAGGAALTACNPVSKKDGVILTINNGSDLPGDIKVDDIFNKYLTKSSGVSAYYNAICEVVIRASIEVTAEIENDAVQSVNERKDLAKSNASSNGTSYKDELDTILSNEGVEDLEELKDKFIYEKLKEKANDDYFDAKENDGKFELLKEYINKKVPYHISHILVKTNEASANDDGYDGRITEGETTKLVSVIRRLANGRESFGSVAISTSEDTSSGQKYGDVGIVTTDTGFVNEFKLGMYAFDLIYNNVEQSKAADAKQVDKTRLGMTDYAANYFTSQDIVKINYNDVLEMEKVSNIENDVNGYQVNNGNARYYPRNVYFNQLFNSHKPALIVSNTAGGGFKSAAEVPELANLLNSGEYALCTSTNKPIIVVRSGSGDSSSNGYQGIFFIVAEKSGLTVSTDDLVEYYDYKKTVSEYDRLSEQGKINYVNFHPATNSEYRRRASEIENAVKGFDQMLDASVFEYYFEKGNFAINDKIEVEVPKYNNNNEREGTETLTLEQAITNYIANTREYYAFTSENTLNNTWDSFIESLENIDSNRATEKRLLPLVCATDYSHANDGTSSAYNKGGVCYDRD